MAIQQENGSGVAGQESEQKPKTLRIKVVDNTKEGRPAVNVRMPIGVVRWGLKMAKTFSPQMKDVDVDWDIVAAMIESGEIGKIVDVEDEVEHKTVEIWVE